MKKFISSALALTLIASVLAGCSSNTASTSDPGSAPESSTPAARWKATPRWNRPTPKRLWP